MDQCNSRRASDWKRDPEAYSRRCRNIRRAKERMKTAYVQRLFAAAVALWAVVVTAALIVAVK